ncbi:MAG: linear amide C-N hydrolase [Pirellulales bacterium]|nr:linear amide C-N hydrolase [Pirellulales bacterium]
MRFGWQTLLCTGLVMLVALFTIERHLPACTRALYVSPDHDFVLVGRNMDWPGDMKTNLWIVPRGGEGHGLAAHNPLEWQVKYGSVVATAYDVISTDGMNEAGLVAAMQWLPETNYGQRDESRPGLCVSMWLQFCLDSFATVDEVARYFQESQVQIVPAICPYDVIAPLTVHLGLSDKTGDSLVLEYIDGQVHLYRGKDAAIMTNSPTQDRQLAYRRQFKGLGGERDMLGDCEPENRFVRASYFMDELPTPQNQTQAVAEVLSVMRAVGQPYGRKQGGEPFAAATVWRTVADLTDQKYYFESTTAPNLIWVDLTKIDFTRAQQLTLVDQPDRVGDVTKDFKAHALFTPLAPSEESH